jgi:hypothetical protein
VTHHGCRDKHAAAVTSIGGPHEVTVMAPFVGHLQRRVVQQLFGAHLLHERRP